MTTKSLKTGHSIRSESARFLARRALRSARLAELATSLKGGRAKFDPDRRCHFRCHRHRKCGANSMVIRDNAKFLPAPCRVQRLPGKADRRRLALSRDPRRDQDDRDLELKGCGGSSKVRPTARSSGGAVAYAARWEAAVAASGAPRRATAPPVGRRARAAKARHGELIVSLPVDDVQTRAPPGFNSRRAARVARGKEIRHSEPRAHRGRPG